MSHLEVARAAVEKVINSPEYQLVYDIYDQGANSPDAIQVALENLKTEIELAIEQIRDFRP